MLREALREALEALGGEVRVRGGTMEFIKVVAERKAFLSRKKLVYRAWVRVNEENREVHLSESLTETSSGLASESGCGVKRERYRTRMGPREGDIVEMSRLFGKAYSYTFDFASVRDTVERVAHAHGYTVHHHLTGG